MTAWLGQYCLRIALAEGVKSFLEPTDLDRWRVTIAFVTDRDG